MHSGGEDTHTLAKAAEKQSGFAQASATTAQAAYVADNRAFIGPSAANIAPVQLNTIAKVQIQYKNTGREPAGINLTADAKFYDAVSEWGSTSAVDILSNKVSCMVSNAPATAYAFPNSGFSQYQENVEIKAFAMDQDVISGKKVIAIMGCANYRTLGQMRHTAYCFFLKNGETSAANLTFCPNGWDAD